MRTLVLVVIAMAVAAPAYTQSIPPAPGLTAGAEFKGLRFDWDPVAIATRYELEYKAGEGAPFVQLGNDLPASASSFRYRLPLHLFDWTFARYRVAACNASGCARSNEVSVSALRRYSVGYFKPAQTLTGGLFGDDVDVSPDGLNLAVTAPGEPLASGGEGGAIHVFRRTAGGAWRERARLEPTRPFSDEKSYRPRVGISADGNTVVLGMASYFHEEFDPQSGEAFVFRFEDGTWTRTRLLSGTRGHFGRWVAINDAGNIIAVATGEEFTPTQPRRIFIYRLTAGVWQPVRAIVDRTGRNEFCEWGALSGDGTTLAEPCAEQESGAANLVHYVRTHSGSNWTVRADMPLELDVSADWGFGTGGIGIDASGDTIAARVAVIPAPRDPDTGPSEVHVFRREAGVYSKVAGLAKGTWRDVREGGAFGFNLAVSGDGGTLVVGDAWDNGLGLGPRAAPLSPGDSHTGAVYVYRLRGSWRLANVVKPNYRPGAEDAPFFTSLALNGNGQTLVVGDPFEASEAEGIGGDWSNAEAPQSGAVWMY